MATNYGSYSWPGSVSSSPSVGSNGAAIPLFSDLIGGENPSGNLQPLQTDSSGALLVTQSSEDTPFLTKDAADGTPGSANPTTAIQVAGTDGTDLRTISTNASGQININNISGTVSLPTGASTATNQTNVQSAPGTPQTVAITVQGNSSGVAVPVSVASLPLPTGAATSANQTNASQKTQLVDGSGNVIASTSNALNVQVENFPATQPISGSVTATQATGTNLHTVVDSGTITTVSTVSSVTAIADALPAGTNTLGGTFATTPTAKTVTNAAVTVGTSAVRCTVSGSAPASTRVVLVVTPDPASSATFYIGTSTVTNSGATRGVAIVAGQSFIANNDAGDYWIVSSTASQTVEIMEQA